MKFDALINQCSHRMKLSIISKIEVAALLSSDNIARLRRNADSYVVFATVTNGACYLSKYYTNVIHYPGSCLGINDLDINMLKKIYEENWYPCNPLSGIEALSKI